MIRSHVALDLWWRALRTSSPWSGPSNMDDLMHWMFGKKEGEREGGGEGGGEGHGGGGGGGEGGRGVGEEVLGASASASAPASAPGQAVPEPFLAPSSGWGEPPWRQYTPAPPPPTEGLDLRLCRNCGAVGYLRKGACVNMLCVS
jgi:hypothetical protein